MAGWAARMHGWDVRIFGGFRAGEWSRRRIFALNETRDILLSLGSSPSYLGPKTILASEPTPIPCSSNHPCCTSRANIAGNLEVCELVVRGSMA